MKRAVGAGPVQTAGLQLERLSPRRLLITRSAHVGKRAMLSLSSPSGRDPSAHATAQVDDPQKPERRANGLPVLVLKQQRCGSGAKRGGPQHPATTHREVQLRFKCDSRLSGNTSCNERTPGQDLSPAASRVLLPRGRGSARGCTSNERLLLLDLKTGSGESRAEDFRALSPLGKGRVTDDGCPHCPWHAACTTSARARWVRGPQGAFKPLAGAVKATTGAPSLKTFPVEVGDGAIWLVG